MEDGGFYYGEWTLDQKNRHGRGIIIYENHSKYVGQWSNDKPNGKGKFFLDESNYYEGSFLDGKFNGQGKLIENGSIKMELNVEKVNLNGIMVQYMKVNLIIIK